MARPKPHIPLRRSQEREATSIRAILLFAIIAIPSFGFLPTAHACITATPSAVAETYYVTLATQGAKGPARVRAAGEDIDLTMPDCFWSGTGVEIWQESNGLPGLQPHAHGGCTTDTIVLGAQVAAVTRCVL